VTSSGPALVSEGIEKSLMSVGKGHSGEGPKPRPLGIAPFPVENPTVWIAGSNGDAGLVTPSTAVPPTVSLPGGG